MPFTIDEDRMQTDPTKIRPGVTPLVSLDPAKPPVKAIPHMDFPRVIYLHPSEPFKKIEHRNRQHEIVEVEVVPAEHLTKVVANKTELEAALKSGWKKEPYIAPPLPDPNADLYKQS